MITLLCLTIIQTLKQTWWLHSKRKQTWFLRLQRCNIHVERLNTHTHTKKKQCSLISPANGNRNMNYQCSHVLVFFWTQKTKEKPCLKHHDRHKTLFKRTVSQKIQLRPSPLASYTLSTRLSRTNVITWLDSTPSSMGFTLRTLHWVEIVSMGNFSPFLQRRSLGPQQRKRGKRARSWYEWLVQDENLQSKAQLNLVSGPSGGVQTWTASQQQEQKKRACAISTNIFLHFQCRRFSFTNLCDIENQVILSSIFLIHIHKHKLKLRKTKNKTHTVCIVNFVSDTHKQTQASENNRSQKKRIYKTWTSSQQ